MRRVRIPQRRAALAAGVVVASVLLAAPASADVFDGRIGFTSFRADPSAGAEGGDIFSMNPDGSDVRRLTPSPALDQQPDWSPGGTELAYAIRKPGARVNFEVAKMTADGHRHRRLTTTVDGQASSQPAWFPNARGMLFRRSGPGRVSSIWQLNRLGENPLLRFQPPHPPLYPSFSPDMKKISFAAIMSPTGDTDRGVFVVAADGSGLTTLFDVPGSWDSAPSWSPDGARIAFESNADVGGQNPERDMEIWTMAADGSGARQLTRNTLHDEGPAWSPSGRMLAYTSGPDDARGDIHAMSAAGKHLRRLTSFAGRDESPDWQSIPAPKTERRCGDAVRSGPGARDVRARGRGVTCSIARGLARRWSRGQPKAIGGFTVRSTGFGGTRRVVMTTPAERGRPLVAFLFQPPARRAF